MDDKKAVTKRDQARRSKRLIKAAVRLCEPYVGLGGAVIAGILCDGKVTTGMYGNMRLECQALGDLVGSMVHAVNTCLKQGDFKFRYKAVMVPQNAEEEG